MHYSNDWLRAQIATGRTFDYLYFWGHRPSPTGEITASCLSQWYAAGFEYAGRYFATAEHWMMWHKALTAGDAACAERIFADPDPRVAKSIGRKVKGYDDAAWGAVKYDHVVKGNVLKFGSDPRLKAFLLGTGDAVLVEASPLDPQWGIGMAPNEARRVDDPGKWRGTNYLGYALMEARDALGEGK